MSETKVTPKAWTEGEKVSIPLYLFNFVDVVHYIPPLSLQAADNLMMQLLTATSQLGILFQIIERCAPIPWDELKLPEGRTKKAAQVMIDKEKTKVKRAREANGEETPSKVIIFCTR